MAAKRPFFMGQLMTGPVETSADIRMAAMNLLSMREHSAKELATKLGKKFESTDLINSAVEKLQNDGLQSDQRFAEAFINMRIRQGKGALAIRMELREKGIADMFISEHLSAAIDWDLLALQVYRKKFVGKSTLDLKEKAKRVRFLAGRGFSAANIKFALEHSKTDEA